jgi:hypothetical protein
MDESGPTTGMTGIRGPCLECFNRIEVLGFLPALTERKKPIFFQRFIAGEVIFLRTNRIESHA